MTNHNTTDSNKRVQEESKVSARAETPDVGNTEKQVALGIFHFIERLLLVIVVLLTLGGAAFEIRTIYIAQTINLADTLLMFLYLQVI